jgi:hypothetical protein
LEIKSSDQKIFLHEGSNLEVPESKNVIYSRKFNLTPKKRHNYQDLVKNSTPKETQEGGNHYNGESLHTYKADVHQTRHTTKNSNAEEVVGIRIQAEELKQTENLPIVAREKRHVYLNFGDNMACEILPKKYRPHKSHKPHRSHKSHKQHKTHKKPSREDCNLRKSSSMSSSSSSDYERSECLSSSSSDYKGSECLSLSSSSSDYKGSECLPSSSPSSDDEGSESSSLSSSSSCPESEISASEDDKDGGIKKNQLSGIHDIPEKKGNETPNTNDNEGNNEGKSKKLLPSPSGKGISYVDSECPPCPPCLPPA